ncbi:hypothetical protein BGX29_007049 [Mortierella sp. GBA35]|nr:hypothetical protein BGX29_007049 [Mortierella sp. GBA35]
MRTQEEQENDMDIISALEIADVKAHHASSSISCQHQHPLISTNLDAVASVPSVLGGSRLEQDEERPIIPTRTFLGTADRRILDTFVDQEDEQQQQQQRRQLYELPQQAQDLDMDLDMGEEGMVKLEGGADESDSILGVEMGHLNPIPFSDLPSLTSIGLCSRGIVRLSSNIKLLASATCVQICCNELDSIPMEIGFLRNLTLLDLTKNCLKSLPESITHLSKLVELKLSFNQLETIPAGIGGLTKLASLTLDNNRIISIPPQIGLIKELVNLDLSSNPIKVLPAEVGKLQFLRRLKLDNCPLVEEFVHSPVHSPPTLLELAARVIVRHDVQIPKMMLPHLKAYVESAQTCAFCDGPYFDSWIKRGKLIEKNEIFIPLEYTLCQPHWNTELERVKLLFGPRPITSPPPKPTTPRGAQKKNSDSTTVATRKSNTRSNSATTVSGSTGTPSPVLYSANSYGSTASSASAANSPAMSSTSPTMTSDSGNEQQQPQQRVRPTLGHRLSMLLKSSKSERRERPLSAFLISTPSSASSSSASSPSLVSSPTMQSNTGVEGETTRPSTIGRASAGLLGRAGLKGSRRPVSMMMGAPSSSLVSSPQS